MVVLELYTVRRGMAHCKRIACTRLCEHHSVLFRTTSPAPGLLYTRIYLPDAVGIRTCRRALVAYTSYTYKDGALPIVLTNRHVPLPIGLTNRVRTVGRVWCAWRAVVVGIELVHRALIAREGDVTPVTHLPRHHRGRTNKSVSQHRPIAAGPIGK